MKTFGATIPLGIGDLLYIKAMFDPIKHEYSEINLNLGKALITDYNRDASYDTFLDEFTKLLFSEEPYRLNVETSYPYYTLGAIATDYGIVPHKPNLSHLLCKGESLKLQDPYVVMNTKVRALSQGYLK